MAGLSEKEKEKQRNLIMFDLAKNFVNNLTAILDVEEEIPWEYLPNKMSLSNNKLTLKFALRETYIEKEIEKLDKAQKKIDAEYGELETIPD